MSDPASDPMEIHIIKNFMASIAEAKVAGLFMNAQQAVPVQLTLGDMGHKQPDTIIN